MGQLLDQLSTKADDLKIPLHAHMDVTWKCNERCIHCYLDHGIGGDMTTDEIKSAVRSVGRGGNPFPDYQRRRDHAPQGYLRNCRLRALADVRCQAENQRHSHRRARGGALRPLRGAGGRYQHLFLRAPKFMTPLP